MFGLVQRRKGHAEGTTSADISGSVSDSQLAIGRHIVQNNLAAGAIVNQIRPGEEPRGPHARPRPLSVLPRPARRLFGRTAELEFAANALASREPLQIFGEPGLGKTALLRHIAHDPHEAFPDGVVYYRSRHESLDDVLLRIFEFLYEYESRVKPTAGELATDLADTQALFLLDDIELEREDLETLLLTAPRSVFVLASPERSLWGDGRALGLHGLDEDAAVALVEQQLERPLVGDERSDFAALCRALQGHPLQLVKAAAQVREQGARPRDLIRALPGSAARSLTAQIAGDLSAQARDALALLAALDGAPLHADDVAALTGRSDSATLLTQLEQRGLVQTHGPRYATTAPLSALQPADAVRRWRAELLSYFIARAERHETQIDDLEPIIPTLRHGIPAARYADVLRLARPAEGVAALAGLWDAWRMILETALDAARRAGDQEQEAWALHQLGTRALCLDDDREARRRLGEALQLRVWTSDETGAAVTRHNIGHLPGAPPVPPSGSSGPAPWIAPVCASVVAVLGVGALAPYVGNDDSPRDAPSRISAAQLPSPSPDRSRRVSATARLHRSGKTTTSPVTAQDGLAASASAVTTPQPALPAPGGGDPSQPSPSGPGDAGRPHPGPPPNPPSGDVGPGVPVQGPPPDPTSTPQSCGLDLLGVLGRLIRDEVVVVEKLLRLDVPGVVYAQIEAVRNLLLGLGHHCTHTETAALLRAAG